MGERKVLSKYYPPDFDPSKLPRVKKPRDKDNAVRFMLPMSVRCLTCGAFMGQGLKFNARKHNTDEDYLGVKIYRFTMRCKQCPAQFAIKTDPKNSDYVCESGVKRNFEPWRAQQEDKDAERNEREEADQDVMVALENKQQDAKSQMEELDALHELKEARGAQARITPDAVLGMKRSAEQRKVDEAEGEIREAVAEAFAKKRMTIRRVGEGDNAGRGEGNASEKGNVVFGRKFAESKSKFPKPVLAVKFKPKKNVEPSLYAAADTVGSAAAPVTLAVTGIMPDYSSSDSDASS